MHIHNITDALQLTIFTPSSQYHIVKQNDINMKNNRITNMIKYKSSLLIDNIIKLVTMHIPSIMLALEYTIIISHSQ